MRTLLLFVIWTGISGTGWADSMEPITVEDLERRRSALESEMERALTLELPDQPSPYMIRGRLVTGSRTVAEAEFGALSWSNIVPIATAGIDFRVGDIHLDNGNFSVGFGDRSGVVGRSLPVDSDELAIRRELWLALDGAFKGATEQYAAKVAARAGRSSPRDGGPSLLPVHTETVEIRPPRDLDLTEVERLARELSGRFSPFEGLEEGRVQVWETSASDMLVSTDGPPTARRIDVAVVLAEAIVRAEDGARIRGVRTWVVNELSELPDVASMATELEDLGDDLISRRDAPVQLDYLGPVIFEGSAAAEFFRQLLVPEICGTPPAEVAPDPWETRVGTISPSARLGRRLLPEGWTVDDRSASFSTVPGGSRVDVEGQPTRDVALVRDGVVQDLLMSRIPREGFTTSTGHGRIATEDRVIAVPGVVEVRPRRSRRLRRLERRALQLARQADLPYVLVVRELTPLSMYEDLTFAFGADARTPGLSQPLEVERLYLDGRRELVRGLDFVGVDRRALRDIVMAGPLHEPVAMMEGGPGSSRFMLGESRGVPTRWTVPSILVAELELRGHVGEETRVLSSPYP